MRPIPTSQLQPGMALARPLFGPGGDPLLPAGAELSGHDIAGMAQVGISAAYVRDPRVGDVAVHEPVPPELRAHAVRTMRTVLGRLEQGDCRLDLAPVQDLADALVEALDRMPGRLQVLELKGTADYTFGHVVNVAVLGTDLGRRLGFARADLRDLATGLLFHDVGNAAVPPGILRKPGKLTDDEFRLMSEHARAGFELLRPLELSAHAKIVALQHHEKFDGTGYPKGLKGHDIHVNGQIGAIADVFDSLCSDRAYRARFAPHEALAFLVAGADRHFGEELVERFVAGVAPYPPGTTVKLSTGDVAMVVAVDEAAPERPHVRIVVDAQGRAIARPTDLSLAKCTDVAIHRVLDGQA